MKKTLLAAYLFFCTGGTYAQQRQKVVVAEFDFYKPPTLLLHKADTIRATFLITRGRMQIAHSYEGYAVIRQRDTIYLDDRMRPLKAPVTVWNAKLLKPKP